jgi:solute carrier family 20 (sodium-dependent phosphate transporter)
VKNDPRIRCWHIPLGPLLLRANPPLYLPGKGQGDAFKDHYSTALTDESVTQTSHSTKDGDVSSTEKDSGVSSTDNHAGVSGMEKGEGSSELRARNGRKKHLEPEERFLAPTKHLPLYHPARLWGMTKFLLLQGVTRDCVSHSSKKLANVHSLARRYDNRVEHLWTYAQVASAMLMSIAHGSNDVANAVGPWSAAFATYRAGEVATKSPTPVWILVVAGFLLGAGFWFYGYHIIRALGNRITQISPTRGYAIELGAAITVLMASRLGLPVSTTQCLTGATLGVALMNYDLGAVNWRQMLYILMGWILTLPSAGLISGLLMLMALNAPHF